MAVNVVLNGVSYSIPDPGDTAWGQGLTNYFIAQASGLLQKAGGAFTLTAEVDFGATYGLKSTYFKSRHATPAAAGQVRLGNTESISWRNAANGADLALAVDASNNLTYNGVALASSSGVVPATSGGTGISSYTTGDTIYASASNVLSKLAIGAASTVLLSNGTIPSWSLISNASIDAAAAIAFSKLAALPSAQILIGNASNIATATAITGDIALSNAGVAAISTGVIVDADINGSAAIALSKFAALTASRALQSSAGGVIEPSSVTSTELGYVSGVTSAIQTQLDAKVAKSTLTTKGDVFVATGASTVVRQAIGTDGQVLTADSTQTNGLKWAAAAAVTTYSITSKTAAYTLTASDYTVTADASGGAFTLTLPAAASNSGRIFLIKRTDNTPANAVTIDGNASETIDGATTRPLYTQYESLSIQSDGTNWVVLDHKCDTSTTAYTPTWTASTTNPTIGNGTLSGFWTRNGDRLIGQIRVAIGSTSTAGSGTYRFALPTGMTIDSAKISLSTGSTISNTIGDGHLYDSGVSSYPIQVNWDATNSVINGSFWGNTASISDLNFVNSGTPFAPTTNDEYILNFSVPITGWWA